MSGEGMRHIPVTVRLGHETARTVCITVPAAATEEEIAAHYASVLEQIAVKIRSGLHDSPQ